MCTSQAIRDDVLPEELSAQVEHTGWEARQRQDMPRLEESISSKLRMCLQIPAQQQ